jgi:hypothetical protein
MWLYVAIYGIIGTWRDNILKVSVSKSKNTTTYYLSKSVRIGSRTTTKTIEKIGTYEVSIQPFEDCCTIFVAKHPVTKPHLDVIQRSEEKLKDVIDDLMKEAVETAETIRIE